MENIEFDDELEEEDEDVIFDFSEDDSEEEYNPETAEVDDGDEEPEEIEPPEPFNRFTPDDDDTAEDPEEQEGDGIADVEEEGEGGDVTPVEDDSDDATEEEDIETEEEDDTIFIEEFIHEDDIVVGDDDEEEDEEPEEEIPEDEEPEPSEPEEELPLIELADEEEPEEEEAVPVIDDVVVIPDGYDPSTEEEDDDDDDVNIDLSEDDSEEEYNEATEVTPSMESEQPEEETEDEAETAEENVEHEEGMEYTEDPYAIYDEEPVVETDEETESEPVGEEDDGETEDAEEETEYEPDPEPSEEPVEEYDPNLDDASDGELQEEEEETPPEEPSVEENDDVEEEPDYYLIEFQTDEPVEQTEPTPEPSETVVEESADEPEDEPEEPIVENGYALGSLDEEQIEEEPVVEEEGDDDDEEVIEVVDTGEAERLEVALGYDDEEQEEGVEDEAVIEEDEVPEPDEDEGEIIEDNPDDDEESIVRETVIDTVASLPNAKHFAVEELSVNVGHIQDLHGYNAPWGAGQHTNIGKLSSANVSTGSYYTAVYDDTGVTVVPTSSSGRVGYLFDVIEGVTYTISYKAVSDGFSRIYYATENNVWDSETSGYLFHQTITDTLASYSYTFTATASGMFFFGIYVVSDTSESDTGQFLTVTEFQLEVGAEMTPFSPYSNICPIVGHSKTVIRRSGINLCESIHTWDSVAVDSTVLWIEFELREGTEYTISFVGMVDNQLYLNPLIFETGTVTVISGRTSIQATTRTGLDKTDVFQYQSGYGWAVFKNYILQNNSNVFNDVQIEYGNTASDYAQTDIETLEISWAEGLEKVFDGVLNVKTGVFTVLNEEIESYSGEELPSTWMSDRDEYVEGTTPTLGAQVVFSYAEPMIYMLPEHSMNLLSGQNYVWADTGDVNVTYRTAESSGEEIENPEEPIEPDEPNEPNNGEEPIEDEIDDNETGDGEGE